MKPAAPAAVLLVFLASACGKVGDPKPPINRTPLAATAVRASQNEYKVVLSWINPARYVDANNVTDLSFVRILRNGNEIGRVEAKEPGQLQSYEINVGNSLDVDLTFSVQVATSRGRFSPASEQVAIRPVQVPGAPQKLDAVVDQDRILLTWEAPASNAALAQTYLVQRSDGPAQALTATRYEDTSFEPDMKYEYTVTAARVNPQIPGGTVTLSVLAKDERAPLPPTGLTIESAPGGAAFLKWDRNTERDFKEVRVYRSDQAEPVLTTGVDGVTDPNYRPGLSYYLVAVDKFGNASKPSASQAGP